MDNKSIWRGKHGPLMIAEIGGNHEGDFGYAKKLTQLAIESGVDFIKYQIYSGDSLVSKVENPERNKHFKKFELSKSQYLELAGMCNEAGIGFMASVWNINAFSWIDSYMPIYKVGSGDLTAYPVIEEICKKGKPIILSTGLSTLQEVCETVEFIRKVNPAYCGDDKLAVLQCTSMYPIPFADSNLDVMGTYSNVLDCTVGYSDHTEGGYALEVAVAKGAQILEFHFTDTREGKTFRDHKVSLVKDEVLVLISKIKQIKALSGSRVKRPLPVEGDHVTTFRRAVYPKTDLKKGTRIKGDDLVVLRPNHGIDARDFDQVIGKELLEDVKSHQRLEWKYFKGIKS